MKAFTVQRIANARGALSFPGDKSLSHRAIIFGALAEGVSHFTNVLPAEDCVCTRRAFEAMGVRIVRRGPSELWVHGRGLHGLRRPRRPLWMGNSGTAMRLLLGILAGQPFTARLTGDPSLSSRPMRRVTDPLSQMGAKIQGKRGGDRAPLSITGAKVSPIKAKLKISSAQVKSAILLAGLYADGVTSVTEPVRSRDHTERFLRYFGVPVAQKGARVSVRGPARLRARSFEIAGDISSAAFFMALSVLVPGADIRFRNVLWNPTRIGIVNVLKRMGVSVRIERLRREGPEPAADFRLLRRGPLKAFTIRRGELPSLIDEVPILCVLATQARGRSVIEDADELRVKETDRIRSMTEGLTRMGARIRARGNTLIIDGPTPLRGAEIRSFGDHRTAMSHIIAGLAADGRTRVTDVECIDTSFPDFFKLLKKLTP